jgi:hypothetical protein
VCLLLAASGCRTSTQQAVIARVGSTTLTLEEAKAYIDTTRVPYDDQVQAYALHWVNDELIYQEAVRNNIEDDKQFKERLSEAHRQLAIQLFLEQKLESDTSSVSEQSVQEYFQNHAQEFVLDDDVLKLNFITFRSREHANAFAGEIQAGTPWVSAISMAKHDSVISADIVSNATDGYYTQRTLYPIDLWRIASTLGQGEISFPVKTARGYTVLQLLFAVKKGSPAVYDIVRNEVRERYFIEHRKQQFTELLKKLRQQYNVDISLTSVTSDTAKSITHE